MELQLLKWMSERMGCVLLVFWWKFCMPMLLLVGYLPTYLGFLSLFSLIYSVWSCLLLRLTICFQVIYTCKTQLNLIIFTKSFHFHTIKLYYVINWIGVLNLQIIFKKTKLIVTFPLIDVTGSSFAYILWSNQ